jgi:NAD(P)-dependent dehydrogenase (short-subunit alcohol dehydrogenase family)
VLFTYELARRLKGINVTVNCLHPGAVAINLVEKDKDIPSFSKLLYKLIKPFFKSPEKGAETILYLALSSEVKDISGKYFLTKR